jgi:hypothetical protein
VKSQAGGSSSTPLNELPPPRGPSRLGWSGGPGWWSGGLAWLGGLGWLGELNKPSWLPHPVYPSRLTHPPNPNWLTHPRNPSRPGQLTGPTFLGGERDACVWWGCCACCAC